MTDNLRLSQRVNAYYVIESTYGTCPASTIRHAGLLDTFDPRNVEKQYTPMAAVGKSTDSHIVAGPSRVTVPFKIGMWGDGWKDLLGRAIGVTASAPQHLTTSVDSVSLLADEETTGSAFQSTLVSGVSFNSVVLEADYTTNTPITLDFDAFGYFLNDRDNAVRDTSRNFNSGFLQVNLSGENLPSEPTTNPITASDMTVSIGTHYGNATQTTKTKGINIDGPSDSYVEIGERYMKFYKDGAIDSSVGGSGTIDLSTGNQATIGDGTTSGAAGGLAKIIDDDSEWQCEDIGSSQAEASVNLIKGIYNTGTARDIFVATDSDTSGLASWPYLKTVKLTITNNLVPLPASVTANSITKHLQHANVTKGKADVILDITATAKDETFFDLMNDDATIPLVRLDFGTNGSIALTNGKIMSRTAPYTSGGEVVETIQMKFMGNGDIYDWTSYAVSADWATN